MDKQIQVTIPDYKRIYSDILLKKYPEKKEKCSLLLEKRKLSCIDVIEINRIIFSKNKKIEPSNQKLKAYRKSDIFKILDYQKNNNLNNSQLAKHFNLSRNTVAKWRKMFL